ncbi:MULTISPECIES: helix-turn-helix domain-containing protein [Chitinophagaceae]
MTTTSEHIRFSSLISDPEAYINEMFQLHPEAKHDPNAGFIAIKNPVIDSAFRYQLLEEGLFLFTFHSFSPVDAAYEFIPNPNASYYTLVFYCTEERSKNPIYIKTDGKAFSGDQFSMFFNGNKTAEIFIKAKQKAYGLRVDIHKDWLFKNIDTKHFAKTSLLKNILDLQTNGYEQSDCENYLYTIKKIQTFFEEPRSTFHLLLLKTLVYQLIVQYLSAIDNSKTTHSTKAEVNNGELYPALHYLEKDIFKDFPGVDYLATLCNMSTSSFIRKFKDTFHTSPADYFKLLKFKEAVRLLKLGKSIKEVAPKIGYKNTAAFGRAFKEIYGKSPAVFIRL